MSQEKPTQDETTEPIIIQEKVTKKNGEVTIKKYLKGKVLGKGGFATCYEITDLEKNRVLAAKIVSKASLTKKRALEKLLAEIKIHKSLQHENIVQFEHVFEDKENVYILLEICPNQTLKELLKKQKRFSEAECACYLSQTINALKYLHARKIIHRDLKLGNLLLGKSLEIKVADLGLAAKIEQEGERRRTICGTPNYIAPEVLDKKIGHSYEVDIWSLGVICYTLLIGRPPFETNDTKATYRRILKANYIFPNNVQISENAKDFIKRILVLEPTKRPTLDEALDHPFMKAHAKLFTTKPTDSTLKPPAVVSNKNIPQTQPFTNTNTDVGFINTMTPSNGKDLPQKVIEENGLDTQGTLKLNDRLGNDLHKFKNFDSKPDNFLNTFSSQTSTGQNRVVGIQNKPDYETFVTKWADYSSKYGLGYLLSNGSAGIVFKDLSRITLSPDGNKFEYIKKKNDQKREVLVTLSIDDYPKELQKKVVLLNYFKSYLQGTSKTDLDDRIKEDGKEADNGKSAPLVYVKKWMKTKYAIMFRLSNKIVQVDFTDNTQIILSPAHQVVCYKNKKGEQTQHPLSIALETDYPEMVKRLKYTKEILTYFKTVTQEKFEPNSAAERNRRMEVEGVGHRIDGFASPDIYKEANTERLPHAYAMPGLSSPVDACDY